jgi:hypothetical protein
LKKTLDQHLGWKEFRSQNLLSFQQTIRQTIGLLLDLEDNDKNKANLVRTVVGSTAIMKVPQQCSRQGPSSPAVVSSTSQEEQDDKQEEEQEENASSLHAARVVSIESMDSKCYDSSLSVPQQE